MNAPTSSAIRIFFSHSHADNAFCLPLVEALRRRYGDDAVWFDISGGLAGGDEWWSRIRQELRARPIFIVALSSAAMASHWVNDEVSLAWNQRSQPSGKYIIPLILESDASRDDLETLRNKISFVPPRTFDASFAALTKQLDEIGRKLAVPAASPSVVAPVTAAASQMREAVRHAPRALVPVGLVVVLMASLLGVLLASRPNATTSTSKGTSSVVVGTSGPTAPPTVPPNLSLTGTATTNMAYNEPAPGCNGNAPFWNLSSLPQVSNADDFAAKSLSEAYRCLTNEPGLELLLQNRVAGGNVAAGISFIGPVSAGATSSLPVKHVYQLSVVGITALDVSIAVDRTSFSLTQYGTLGWAYSISQTGVDPTPVTSSANIIDLPNASFSFTETCDGQQVSFAVNGVPLQTLRLVQQPSGAETHVNVLVTTTGSTRGSVTLKDFRFSPK